MLESDPDSLETFEPALQVIDDCMSPTATKDPIEIKIYAFFTLASVSLDPWGSFIFLSTLGGNSVQQWTFIISFLAQTFPV